MSEKTVEIGIPLLIPDLEDDQDTCLGRLETMLQNRRGILRAHLELEKSPVHLCLHYDPNLVSLPQVQEIAQQAGSEFTARYRHEQIPFTGMAVADAAIGLTESLQQLPGMLHAHTNYAAGLIFVAYDSRLLQRPSIEQTIRSLGYRPLPAVPIIEPAPAGHAEHDHDHGSAPTFLPHWMQERWTLILVGLAGLFWAVGWLGPTFLGMSESATLPFFLLAYLAGGYDIATHAIPGLLKGKFDTDVLMLAAALGAAVLGEWSEGAFLLFLFSLGHAGEHYALDRARNAVNALGELMPKTASVRRAGQIVEEKVETLQVGDVVVVRPGDRIPVDGQITTGRSAIDQSPITGESVPVMKGEGDRSLPARLTRMLPSTLP